MEHECTFKKLRGSPSSRPPEKLSRSCALGRKNLLENADKGVLPESKPCIALSVELKTTTTILSVPSARSFFTPRELQWLSAMTRRWED